MIDNRAGAGGALGTQLVAQAAPDGYTVLYGNAGPLAIAPHLFPKLGYDLFKDFAPVSQTTSSPFVVFASTALPVKTRAGAHRLREAASGPARTTPRAASAAGCT